MKSSPKICVRFLWFPLVALQLFFVQAKDLSCEEDSECNEPYMICESSTCTHKGV